MAIFATIKDYTSEKFTDYKQTAITGYRITMGSMPYATPMMIAQNPHSTFEQLADQLDKRDIDVRKATVNNLIRKLDNPFLKENDYKSLFTAFGNRPLILARVFAEKRPSPEFAAPYLMGFIDNVTKKDLDGNKWEIFKKAMMNLSKYPAPASLEDKKLENVALEAYKKVALHMNSDDVLDVYSSSLNYSVKNGILTDLNRLINKHKDGTAYGAKQSGDYEKLLAGIAIIELKGDGTDPRIMRQFKPALKFIVEHKDSDEKIIAKALVWSIDIETVWRDGKGHVVPKFDRNAPDAKKIMGRMANKSLLFNEKDLDNAVTIIRSLPENKISAVLEFMKGLNPAITDKLIVKIMTINLEKGFGSVTIVKHSLSAVDPVIKEIQKHGHKIDEDAKALTLLNSIDPKNPLPGIDHAASVLLKMAKKDRENTLHRITHEDEDLGSRVGKAIEVKLIVRRLRKGTPWIPAMEDQGLTFTDVISDINNDPEMTNKGGLMIRAIEDFRKAKSSNDVVVDFLLKQQLALAINVLFSREHSAQDIIDLANIFRTTQQEPDERSKKITTEKIITEETRGEISDISSLMAKLGNTKMPLSTVIKDANDLTARMNKEAEETRKMIEADKKYREDLLKLAKAEKKKAKKATVPVA